MVTTLYDLCSFVWILYVLLSNIDSAVDSSNDVIIILCIMVPFHIIWPGVFYFFIIIIRFSMALNCNYFLNTSVLSSQVNECAGWTTVWTCTIQHSVEAHKNIKNCQTVLFRIILLQHMKRTWVWCTVCYLLVLWGGEHVQIWFTQVLLYPSKQSICTLLPWHSHVVLCGHVSQLTDTGTK